MGGSYVCVGVRGTWEIPVSFLHTLQLVPLSNIFSNMAPSGHSGNSVDIRVRLIWVRTVVSSFILYDLVKFLKPYEIVKCEK